MRTAATPPTSRARRAQPDDRAVLRRGRRARRRPARPDRPHDARPRDSGWTFSALAPNVVDPAAVRDAARAAARSTGSSTAHALTVRLADPRRASRSSSLPLAPMIGCFGVAPGRRAGDLHRDQRPRTAATWIIAGFGPGSVAAFPVFVPGALFFLGDGHACQGDGEIVGTGIETSFEIEFTVRREEARRRIGWPRARRRPIIFTIGNARPARPGAAARDDRDAALARRPISASSRPRPAICIGQVVRYDIGNVFDPAYTVACRIGKRWLERPSHGWLGGDAGS